MATGNPLSFRRRTFLLKHEFQIRFALYPVVLLGVVLGLGYAYLYVHLQESFRLQMYLAHTRLHDPWQMVAPLIGPVAGWGGAVFLVSLSVWVCWRFAWLRGDLERLADWLGELGRGFFPCSPPPLHDREVRALGEGILAAAERFAEWERDVAGRGRSLIQLTQSWSQEEGRDPGEVRQAVEEVRAAVSALRLEEDVA